ncbi:MAG: hypothetical protein K2I60_01600 [Oscillospiraceae bacterium]|nr:hypothetical protein [Oscillospiraceae bacterium]
MNPRNEMKRTMRTFGQPVKIISKERVVDGAGIFQRIFKKSCEYSTSEITKVGKVAENKYSLWLYDYEKVSSVDKVIFKDKNYEVLSGDYDAQIGCWRLIVKEELS